MTLRFASLGGLAAASLIASSLILSACDRGPTAHARDMAAGPTQRGEASYYASHFSGRRMANGERFNPNSNVAAHRTLPLGTVARVTNLSNGRSAVVRVADRGPFVRGRVIDLSPRVAEHLAMKQDGTAPVAVTPLAVDGDNAAAAETAPRQQHAAQ